MRDVGLMVASFEAIPFAQFYFTPLQRNSVIVGQVDLVSGQADSSITEDQVVPSLVAKESGFESRKSFLPTF